MAAFDLASSQKPWVAGTLPDNSNHGRLHKPREVRQWMAAFDPVYSRASWASATPPDNSNHGRLQKLSHGAPYETRTRVPALRGRCPGPLDEGSVVLQSAVV